MTWLLRMTSQKFISRLVTNKSKEDIDNNHRYLSISRDTQSSLRLFSPPMRTSIFIQSR